ncbi:MAG TPA: tetratricopeptide repeat protein, partial [Pirellulales bacterium]|nr:tetratricopeptide repeat protein [Pirellulales bacterium]
NLQIDQGQFEDAKKTESRLQRATKDPVLTEYLEGRVALQKGDIIAATNCFEHVQGRTGDRKDLQKQADFWLGNCYDRIGQLDHRIDAYRRAVEDDPDWRPSRVGLATALVEAGRVNEAIDNYQQLLAAPEAPAAWWQELAKLLIIQELRRPKDHRQWQAAEDAVEHASKAGADSATCTILQAEILLAQDESDQATRLLDAASKEQPEVVALWVARAALLTRLGHEDVAGALLDQAQSKLGDRPEIRQEKIREALLLSHSEAERQLAELAKGWDQFSKEEQFTLNRQMAIAYTMIGAGNSAEEYWRAAVSYRPEWLPGYLYLFDAAASHNDQSQLLSLLDDIHRIEGKDQGPLWCYGEAARQVLLFETGDRTHLATARNLLDQALVQRPRWSRAFVLLGEIEKLDGNSTAAIERYMAALEFGERSSGFIRDLVSLLYQRQRFEEADRVLRQLEDQQAPFSADLNRLASEVSWRVEDYGRALELAKNAAAGSKNIDDHLWLGQLFTLMGKQDEAEKAYRNAVQLLPEEPRAWLALVNHWVQLKASDKVEDTLREAAAHLPSEQIALARAGAMEHLGQATLAESEYRRALELKPNDADVLGSVGEYFLRVKNPLEAEKAFRALLQPTVECTKARRAAARRQVALLLASSNQYVKLQEALSLLSENQESKDDEDERVKAIVLSGLPGHDSRAAGIQILQQLVDREPNSTNDRYLLAQLYDADGQWSQARNLWQSLISADGSQRQTLAFYIRGLLAHHELAEAETWLGRLAMLKPDDMATVELRAQLDVAKGRIDAALTAVQQHGTKLPGQTAEAWEAQMLDRLTQECKDASAAQPLINEAQRLYRVACQHDPKLRAAAVRFLSREKRVDEALEICAEWTKESGSTDALVAAAAVVSQSAASDSQRDQVELEIRNELAKHPQAHQLSTALGGLYEFQSRFNEATEAYHHALEVDAKDIVALNDLALLLTYRGEPGLAQPLINQAVQIAGPLGALLDSRGTVLLAMNKPDAAVADFSAALADQPTAPRWFHLSLARFRLQEIEQAKQAYQQAVALGLNVDQLHALEKPEYTQLVRQMVQ